MAQARTTINSGIIGCGTISKIYLENSGRFNEYTATACADLDPNRAQQKAEEYGIRACSVEELLADPDIDIVVNLTIPQAHVAVGLAALAAGKSIYNEKPLALDREGGRQLLDLARERGVRVGCAPDTFLGGGLQTCRRLIDDGAIGVPIAATAFMLNHGHEQWHPDPAFYYQRGGGPLFDMGPYYLTALISLLGPVRRVSGSARITFQERTITSEPKRGQTIAVEIPTHVAGVLDFASGAVGTIITSFDVWAHRLPWIEIYGSEGSLSVPNPNIFRGPVRLRRAGEQEWREMPLTHGHTENSRGLGVADLAQAIHTGQPHRANGDLAYHVLDVMHGIHESSTAGRHIDLTSDCARPAALPSILPGEILDT